LHPAAVFNIADASIARERACIARLFVMIVCSCNVISDHDVRAAVTAADALPRTPGQVYRCLGCSAECGRCARTIKKILDEALGGCAKACGLGCPHSRAHKDAHNHAEPGLVETAA
jgi:bacterioferritin-associated ferredoxin